MGFRAMNDKNEEVLSLSRSKMDNKRKVPQITKKCECSACGQIAFIVESKIGSIHETCKGMRLDARARVLNLRKPAGKWDLWSEKTPIVA